MRFARLKLNGSGVGAGFGPGRFPRVRGAVPDVTGGHRDGHARRFRSGRAWRVSRAVGIAGRQLYARAHGVGRGR